MPKPGTKSTQHTPAVTLAMGVISAKNLPFDQLFSAACLYRPKGNPQLYCCLFTLPTRVDTLALATY
jgi:hypothetical protein